MSQLLGTALALIIAVVSIRSRHTWSRDNDWGE